MTNPVNTFFYEHSQYLNDLYGIDYTKNYDRLYGWADCTSIFVDSVMLWCAYDSTRDDSTAMIKFFMGIVKATLSLAFLNHQYRTKFIRKGTWCSFDETSEKIETCQSSDITGYLGINVTFHDIDFANVIHSFHKVLAKLRDNNVIMRSIDVTVDCGHISTEVGRNWVSVSIVINQCLFYSTRLLIKSFSFASDAASRRGTEVLYPWPCFRPDHVIILAGKIFVDAF